MIFIILASKSMKTCRGDGGGESDAEYELSWWQAFDALTFDLPVDTAMLPDVSIQLIRTHTSSGKDQALKASSSFFKSRSKGKGKGRNSASGVQYLGFCRVHAHRWSSRGSTSRRCCVGPSTWCFVDGLCLSSPAWGFGSCLGMGPMKRCWRENYVCGPRRSCLVTLVATGQRRPSRGCYGF